ncbi:hypothetical protein [Methanocella arvoryzae]|uniref:CARDB domain-containing protein n=1 Tax=Methanocella arvoryzae (strain DSM 22066 / NBRC 105507 / MRE50) TaxID=351160 RepID=Q0W4V6_METAR|nr:hypothetical protein [Methanocella arvoryzae]CAJ36587.1 hypothetical protein RCIX1295 [Methanocella arvoryzae MRE50]
MRISVKLASICLMLVLLLTITTPAFAATTNPVLSVTGTTVAPVASVTPTTATAPLMPGDTGTVVVTLTNTLKSPGTGNTTVITESHQNVYPPTAGSGITTTRQTQTSSSDGSSGACELKFVNLLSEGPIHVQNAAYTDVGYLGLGDSAQFQFTIKVDDSAADGKYYLPLKVKTDNDECYVNQVVPVVIDSTQPRLVLNDAPSKLGTSRGNIIIDVVNYRSSGINSASVIPEGAEFTFKPRAEYTVGSIGAGEMYTVTFETSSKNATYTGNPSFVLKYKNGDNWHQTAPLVVGMEPKTDAAAAGNGGGDNTLLILGGVILVVLVLIGGVYLFMRSQRSKK